jgi:Uma2 family endonuclease
VDDRGEVTIARPSGGDYNEDGDLGPTEGARMATAAQKLITAEEFFLMPEPGDGSQQELVRGEIVMTPPPGFRHGLRQGNAYWLLESFARTSKLGRVTVESGVITERDPDTVRGPDVAYWSYDRLPADQEPVGYPEVAADLCVEVMSQYSRLEKILEKLREYFARGVRMVWIIDPDNRLVHVYRSADEGRILRENDALSGEDVLPGFSCRVAELFA